MDIGVSLFLIAVGAILAFAVDVELSGIDLNIVGWILIAIGVVGLLLSFLYWRPRRRTVVRERGVRRGEVYTDEPPPPL